MKALLLKVRIGIGKVSAGLLICQGHFREHCLTKSTAIKFEKNSFICVQFV